MSGPAALGLTNKAVGWVVLLKTHGLIIPNRKGEVTATSFPSERARPS